MSVIREWLQRLWGTFHKAPGDAVMEEELRLHLEMVADDLQHRGLTPEEALRQARLQAGGVAQAMEQRRDQRGLPWLEDLLQDARFGARMLGRAPLITAVTLLTLTLAIGANTTVFTFVNALLLQPLPLADPARLVALREAPHGDPGNVGAASYSTFLEWRARASEVGRMAAQRPLAVRVSDGGPPERHAGSLVSWNFFPMLGIQPASGRGFLESEDAPGGAPVVLLSHALWTERYQQDPQVIGRTITVNGTARVVVGIMPPELGQLAMDRVLRGARLWIPIGSATENGQRDERNADVYVRLSEGVTGISAVAQLRSISEILERQDPLKHAGWGVVVEPLKVSFSETTRAMILMMTGAVAFVLLIACANVANLTLARVTGRRREIATRLALGASCGRIVRQLLAESVIVALASIPPGIALAIWGRALLLGDQATPEMYDTIAIDTRVLLYTIGLAALASVLSGLLPTLHAVRRLQHTTLTTGSRHPTPGASHGRVTHGLIVVEVALALMLLVGASLFVRSFENALRAEGGFDTSRILAVTVEMTADSAAPSDLQAHQVDEFVDRLRSVPGVTHAAAANLMPLRTAGDPASVVADDGPSDAARVIFLGGITRDFFAVLDVPIVQGRTFTDIEARSQAAVAIVNRTMAGRFWPEASAIGHRFRRATDANGAWFTVIGVSADILTWDVSNRPRPTAYVPYAHVTGGNAKLLVRASGDPALIAPSVRTVLHDVDPTRPALSVQTMTAIHHQALSRAQTLASLTVIVSGIALLLGAVGVYGVLSYAVSQRTTELGIRAALGAVPPALVRHFVGQGMKLAGIGGALGLGGAWAVARVVRGLLHDVSPADPLSFAGATFLLLSVAFVAAYVPARRAARIDPLAAIRTGLD